MKLVGGPRCGQDIDPGYNGDTFICEEASAPEHNYRTGELGAILRIRHHYVRVGNTYEYKGARI